jgi:tetratricopeptide (TPR) repeat protein
VVLYVLLTGRLPHDGHTTQEVLRKIRETEPARPRAVNAAAPAALEAVCRKAMARDPADRYGVAEELAAEVRRWTADEPVAAATDPWAARVGRWARRHRTAVVAAAVFLLSAVAALAVSTGLIWREERRTAEQRAFAEQEWARAEENLGLARGLALNLLDIAETRLAPIRQTEAIRKEMTDAALHTFQQFLRQRPDDPDLRQRTAKLYRYSANVHRNLNETAAATQSYRESLRILEALVAASPTDRAYRDQLAETLRDYSQILNRTGQLRDAAATLGRSAEIAAGLRADAPDRPAYRRTLATTRLDLAGVEHARGQFAAEAAAAREAAELLRGLLDLPKDQSYALDRLLLAMALTRLAVAQRELGQLDDALATHADALAQAKAHLERRNDNDAQHFLGRALVEQGRTRARFADRRPAAEADFNQAILLWEDLQKRFQYAIYREWQALAYTARGDLRAASDRPGPAAEDYAKAQALLERLTQDSPDVPAYCGSLGRTYAALGRLALGRGDPRAAADWLTKAVEALRAAAERAPENALDRQALDDARADLARALAGR